MTRWNDGPHPNQGRAIKGNGVGRRILVVCKRIELDGAGGGSPFASFTASFMPYFCNRTAERACDTGSYSSWTGKIKCNFQLSDETGIITDNYKIMSKSTYLKL
jgi:hypothetical protein